MLAWHKSFEEHDGMCVETEKADCYTDVIRVCNKVKFKKMKIKGTGKHLTFKLKRNN